MPKEPEPPKVPETYSFKFPEGMELDQKVLDDATKLFKDLGLPQESAQKLVDFYMDRDRASREASLKAVEDMRAKWREEVMRDPEIGSKLDDVKTEIGRFYTHLDPKLVSDFKAAMDLTGAGDNPAFIKAIYKMAQLVNEGHHVSGSGPSPEGQKPPGESRPSMARALYPYLQ